MTKHKKRLESLNPTNVIIIIKWRNRRRRLRRKFRSFFWLLERDCKLLYEEKSLRTCVALTNWIPVSMCLVLVSVLARHASFYELKYNRKLFILTSKLVQFNEQFIFTLCFEQQPILAAASVSFFLISPPIATTMTAVDAFHESFSQDWTTNGGEF